MLLGLAAWLSGKSAAKDLSDKQVAALLISVFGGWLFYIFKIQQERNDELLDRDTMLDEWATQWAGILDTAR